MVPTIPRRKADRQRLGFGSQHAGRDPWDLVMHGLFYVSTRKDQSLPKGRGVDPYYYPSEPASEESEHVFPSGSSPDDQNPYRFEPTIGGSGKETKP